MNKEKLNATVRSQLKYLRCLYVCLGTTLATAALQTSALSMNPTSAVDDLQNISPLPESTAKAKKSYILPRVELRKQQRYSRLKNSKTEKTLIPSVVPLSSNIMPQEDKEFIESQISDLEQIVPTLLIAQTDSSGIVGDTLKETSQLRQQFLIDPIIIERRGRAAPASTAGTPSAYGASWGQGYVGAGLYFPFDRDRIDGSAALGFGLGDAVKSVGVEVGLNITSLGGGGNFDFGDSGSIGLKIHKYFADGTAVAVGWSNPIKWGDVQGVKDTFYGVVTKSFDLQPDNSYNKMPLTVSLGVGSGSFRSKGAIAADENSVNVFGSVGLRVIPQVSVVSSWTGNALNVGGSFTPFRKTPLVINAIFTDVTNNLNKETGLAISAGYVFQF